MKAHFFAILLTSMFISCQGQPAQLREVGGPCQGCEALYEYGKRTLLPVDTLVGFETHSPKILLTGKVLEKDGKTPSEGTILYIYHTDRKGIYQANKSVKGWARRHGQYRGWIQTGKDGTYAFYTFRPAAYPNGSEEEHVHLTIKELYTIPYYADSFVFDDDPLLTKSARTSAQNRGGSGIVILRQEGELWVGERDIILGKNIPGYD